MAADTLLFRIVVVVMAARLAYVVGSVLLQLLGWRAPFTVEVHDE